MRELNTVNASEGAICVVFAVQCHAQCSRESWKVWILTGLADNWGYLDMTGSAIYMYLT